MSLLGRQGADMNMARRWSFGRESSLLVFLLLAAALSATPAAAASWTVVGWNNLGMHCTDADFSVFSLLPPYNTIEAQLIDPQGHLITNPAGITLSYEAIADPTGSINTTSQGKLNFSQHSQALFGALLGPEQGLLGNDMPGPGNQPQPMSFDPAHAWFIAEGIPITPYDDAGQKNFYPLMHLVARNSAGIALATSDIVLPVSDEMDCTSCHSSASAPAARPAAGWVNDPDPQRDFRLNVLRLHDEKNAGDPTFIAALAAAHFNPAGLFATAQGDGTAILCANCHLSEALAGSGRPNIKPLTEALHGRHASVVDPTNGLTLDAIDNRSACYRCHPGSVTRCLRGAMGAAVAADGTLSMQCQSCHGSMSKVGTPGRTGWLDEPGCQGCHTGTAVHNNGQIRYTSVFDGAGQPRVAVDATYATNPNTPAAGFSLYRFSTGHGGLQCEACHGSTHAEFPASHPNDNIQSVQHQGHVGMFVECASCHGTQPSTVNGGPHGMHPIGNGWVSAHPNAVEQGGAGACRDCHGADYRGTVLSRSKADRVLSAFGSKNFWRGFQIGCYTCHRGPGEESVNPNRAAVVSSASVFTPVDTPLSLHLSASDADGNPLTLRVVSQTGHGTVGLSGSAATYFPDLGFSGADSFTFAAWDGSTDSNLGTIAITVGGTPPSGTPTPLPTNTPTPNPACGAMPRTSCRTADTSQLAMKRGASSARDMLLWKWSRGQATSQAEFADPTANAVYTLCVYDAGGSVLTASAPPGGGRWRALDGHGYSYRDASGGAQGLQMITLKGSDSDRAKIVLKGRGAQLPALPLGALATPVVVQLVNGGNGLCWEARYQSGDVVRDDADQFKAKAVR